jgi:hypothetical protein
LFYLLFDFRIKLKEKIYPDFMHLLCQATKKHFIIYKASSTLLCRVQDANLCYSNTLDDKKNMAKI